MRRPVRFIHGSVNNPSRYLNLSPPHGREKELTDNFVPIQIGMDILFQMRCFNIEKKFSILIS